MAIVMDSKSVEMVAPAATEEADASDVRSDGAVGSVVENAMVESAAVSEAQRAVWLSVAEMLQGKCDGQNWQFEGRIIDFDEAPRSFFFQII